jgi:hypothetical protein
MATTTNYSWTTPDDTDLVKDGASAIRTLGSAIDTTLKAQIDAQIPDSIIDAKGDLIAGTADNTPAKLTYSGVNNDVLTVDTSTATGLKWAAPAAGGMTLISTTTLTGASITLSSIPATYNNLVLVIRNDRHVADNENLRIRVNADSTASRHVTMDVVSSSNTAFDSTSWLSRAPSDNGTSTSLEYWTIYDYANTTTWKTANSLSFVRNPTTITNFNFVWASHAYNQTGAISSLVLLPASGDFTSGTVLLYGVK